MAITDLDPRLLVEAHNAGDGEAFALIVRRHHDGLFAHARSRLHDDQAAEDAVQETFVRAYRAMPQFSGDFQLRAWLHRIMTNVCHDEGARRQRDGRLMDHLVAHAVIDVDAADSDIERLDVNRTNVAAALDSLPPTYREALVLRFVEDLPYDKVAEAAGVSEGNARVRVMRGRAALRRALSSSHAVAALLVPWLRRGGRPPGADLSVVGVNPAAASVVASSPAVAGHVPMAMRAVEVAPQLAERAASLPQVLGLVAAMAVPVAVPVVGDQVVGWATPPAATAEVADVALPPPNQTPPNLSPTLAPTTSAPTPPRTSTPATGLSLPAVTTPAAPVRPSSTAPPTAVPTTAPPALALSATAPPATVPATTVPAPVPPAGASPSTVPAPGIAPLPAAAFGADLDSSQLTGVGATIVELAGAATWRVDGVDVAGQLSGSLVFDEPAADELAFDEPAGDVPGAPTTTPGAGSDLPPRAGVVGDAPAAGGVGQGNGQGVGQGPGTAEVGGAASDGSVTPSGATTAPAELDTVVGEQAAAAVTSSSSEATRPEAGPRGFVGELHLALGDGRSFRLRLVDGSLTADQDLAAGFELVDACDAVVARGSVSGVLDLAPVPLPSALHLAFDGERPAGVRPCP